VKAAAEAAVAAEEAVALALRMQSDALRLSHQRHIPKAALTRISLYPIIRLNCACASSAQ
jgi:hypothetical protein